MIARHDQIPETLKRMIGESYARGKAAKEARMQVVGLVIEFVSKTVMVLMTTPFIIVGFAAGMAVLGLRVGFKVVDL